ncbi:unnamed protein product (macronuclear) [Paramecium tetraurelia]|uniref:Protein kinase domain-containing protein n=1 Tax=Paramecium tetraurelia TaxID=5888 RepID=A0CFL8_PARTE|nr:uncharacterized protein GSPATT00038025001 [Paramecium tetraurelia]CAK69585.1 unnamed protein product [Paramecium tetraurelia]|eukprot:XP_001436982.1 hypothetical protein (macronuclear) [Paramecium tetraurelia strain d4-2]
MKQQSNRKLLELRQSVKQSLFKSVKTERSQYPTETKRSKSITQWTQFTFFKQNQQSKITKFHDVYRMTKKIGTGAHGVVKICNKIQDQLKINYAVKKLSCKNDPELIRTIIQTFNINRTLNNHPKIIRSYDLYIDENEQVAYWVMEYCNYKSLQSYMYKSIPDVVIQQIMKQLAQTITEIHKKGICHRDLKPDNILVKLHGQIDIKIIDFGVSKKFMVKKKNDRIYHEMWTRTGSLLYQAPETFLGGGYDEKLDVWSVGVILYQLLCGKFPFICDSKLDTIEMITDPNLTINQNKELQLLQPLQIDLLKRLLNKNPEKRLTAEEFSLHPWINQVSTTKSISSDDLQINKGSEIITTSLNLDETQIRIDFSNHIHYTQKQFQELLIHIKDHVIEDSQSRKSSYQIISAHTSYEASPINQTDETQQPNYKK